MLNANANDERREETVSETQFGHSCNAREQPLEDASGGCRIAGMGVSYAHVGHRVPLRVEYSASHPENAIPVAPRKDGSRRRDQ